MYAIELAVGQFSRTSLGIQVDHHVCHLAESALCGAGVEQELCLRRIRPAGEQYCVKYESSVNNVSRMIQACVTNEVDS